MLYNAVFLFLSLVTFGCCWPPHCGGLFLLSAAAGRAPLWWHTGPGVPAAEALARGRVALQHVGSSCTGVEPASPAPARGLLPLYHRGVGVGLAQQSQSALPAHASPSSWMSLLSPQVPERPRAVQWVFTTYLASTWVLTHFRSV